MKTISCILVCESPVLMLIQILIFCRDDDVLMQEVKRILSFLPHTNVISQFQSQLCTFVLVTICVHMIIIIIHYFRNKNYTENM